MREAIDLLNDQQKSLLKWVCRVNLKNLGEKWTLSNYPVFPAQSRDHAKMADAVKVSSNFANQFKIRGLNFHMAVSGNP